MTLTQQVITIGVAVIATMITRFLPFIVFKYVAAPTAVNELGKSLPPAILGMLVVYSYRDVLFSWNVTLLNNVLAGVVVILVFLWRRNLLLAIAAGTLTYIGLVALC